MAFYFLVKLYGGKFGNSIPKFVILPPKFDTHPLTNSAEKGTPTAYKKDINVSRKDIYMWLNNLKELKTAKGLSNKYIAEQTKLPERTVNRIFSGETLNPSMDNLIKIVRCLGGSLDSIFADTEVVVGGAGLITMQTDIDRLTGEIERLTAELDLAKAEIAMLEGKVVNITAENEILRLKLEHKEELLALHNYYIKMKGNE